MAGYSDGAITQSFATGSVSGGDHTGGLAGYSNGVITQSFATGAVTGSDYTGGLVGYNHSSITQSFATGAVSGGDSTGGLAGYHDGEIDQSFATGGVSGGSSVGGLVGENQYGTIKNSYATGRVDGNSYIGGLVGYNDGLVNNSYAAGYVSGSKDVGGLAGYNYFEAGEVTNSFWDTSVTGQTNGIGYNEGTESNNHGLPTEEMVTLAPFKDAGWDIDASYDTGTIWRIYENRSMPLLRCFLTQLTVTSNDDSKVFDDLVYTGNPGVTFVVGTQPGIFNPNGNQAETDGLYGYGNLHGMVTYTSDGLEPGTYKIMPGGLFSNNQWPGYDINFVSTATLTINPVEQRPIEKKPEPIIYEPMVSVVPSVPSVIVQTTPGIIVMPVTPPSTDVPGLVTVTVPRNVTASGSGFSFMLPEQVVTALTTSGVAEKVSMLDGQALPTWLVYDSASKSFTANGAPEGIPTVKVLVTVGGESWDVEITLQ